MARLSYSLLLLLFVPNNNNFVVFVTSFVPIASLSQKAAFTTKVFSSSSQENNVDAKNNNDLTVPVGEGGPISEFHLENFLAVRPFVQETDALWSEEWHDSLLRNGFVDFIPPLSSQLSCLLVGAPAEYNLPDRNWYQSPFARQTPYKGTSSINMDTFNEGPLLLPKSKQEQSTTPGPLQHVLSNIDMEEDMLSSDLTLSTSSTYDCVMDQSLLNELLVTHHFDDVLKLLLEASKRIKEHGIFVVVTHPDVLTEEQRDYLERVGQILGMQWKFNLDGISNHFHSVSVARKYFTGKLPSVGKLAEYAPFPKNTNMPEEEEEAFQ